jgi:acyl carrier protein
MTRDEVFGQIRSMMVEMFELDEADVTLEAKVFEDLDLDSIDAIDLVARLQELSGRRVEEEKLRGVRTVGDIVTLVVEQLEGAEAEGVDVAARVAEARGKGGAAG